MKKILITVLLVLVSLSLTGCFNQAADTPGIWWNPLSWGNQILEKSLPIGCTAPNWTIPSGELEVFADNATSPDDLWVCTAESPNGPYNWARVEEEVEEITSIPEAIVIPITVTLSTLSEVVTTDEDYYEREIPGSCPPGTENTPLCLSPVTEELAPVPVVEAQCHNTDWFDVAVNPEGSLEGSTDIDIELIGTEDCAATWRAASTTTATAVCPEGWVCTFDVVNDIVLVYQGTGQEVQIHAATWRPLGNFCAILNGEINFANSQTPTFQVGPAANSPACGQ